MTKIISHHDDIKPDYPSFAQFQAAATVFVGYLRGTGDRPTVAVAAKAAWVVAGYAESYIPEAESPPVVGAAPPLNNDEAKAQFLEAAVAAAQAHKGAGAIAFDWKALARLALEFALKILLGG